MEDYEKRFIISQKKELLFKVKGENYINKILKDIIPQLEEVFKDTVGLQVLKVGADCNSGQMLKKYKDSVDSIIKDVTCRYTNEDIKPFMYVSNSNYSSFIRIKLRFDNEDIRGFVYYEGTKYFLNIRDLKNVGMLAFCPVEEIDGEEENQIFIRCMELKDLFNKERAKLKPYCLRELLK